MRVKRDQTTRELADARAKHEREMAVIQRDYTYYEALNPRPFPAPGAICRCGPTSKVRPAADCDRAIRMRQGGIGYPCSCWCHMPAAYPRPCGCSGASPHECRNREPGTPTLKPYWIPKCGCECHLARIG